MRFFTKPRLVIAKFLFKKKLAAVIRNRNVFNINSARRVGVLFVVDNFNNCQEVYNFYRYLKEEKKQVSVLGFVNQKEYLNFKINKPDFFYYTFDDLNWSLTPNIELVTKFIQQDFDVLINFSVNEEFSLKYIAGLSCAQFKVGKFNPLETSIYDLMINVDCSEEIKEFIYQVKHYLNLINKNAS